ncbi:vomeronasal type-2 receptor 26-like [Mixophyes fleayi]|uniref:vomeronasal type-2 receptor 26-like n=1 Tax=Mixophyes fleayi TaxID=3061075 RepID=UPI003F4D7F63
MEQEHWNASKLHDMRECEDKGRVFGEMTRWPSPQYYKNVLTFRFAIEQFNKNSFILPNITIGYHVYDSCSYGINAIKSVLQILSGPGRMVPNYSCTERLKIIGFIGDHYSVTTVPIAQLLGVYRYSQISYGATNSVLGDRHFYPTFFQTLQSDHSIYPMLHKVLEYFGWTWIGILASNDDSGDTETALMIKYLTRRGICVAFTIKMSFETCSNKSLINKRNVEIIRNSTARVIILHGTFSQTFVQCLRDMKDVLSDRTIVLNPHWANNKFLMDRFVSIFNGSLVLDNLPIHLPDILRFFNKIKPENYPEDKLLERIYILYHQCCSANQSVCRFYGSLYNIRLHKCSGKELIIQIRSFQYDGIFPRVFLAVYVTAYALNTMRLFLYNNHQKVETNVYYFKQQIPVSRCSEKCLPGSRKLPRSGIHACCYDCVPCSEGEISNATDSENCFTCQDDEWPNEKRDLCIPKSEDFLSYTNDEISAVFISVSCFFCFITQLILGIFISHRDTPIVKANNKNLSFLLLVSIMLSFLCVFLFLGRPVDITCMLRQISFGILFSIAVSSVLAKTIMVCIAFRATKPGSVWRKWMGVKLPNCVVFICSSVQVMISVSWLSISPPFQELDTHSYQGQIIVQCNEGSVIGFYSVLGYMGVLAAVSFITAHIARTLPDSFNEAKYITFSMLVFCSVWIAMIPAYLSTKGKYMVAVEIFSILTSNAGLLGCIFFPKCYIILCRPALNTKLHLLDNRKT